MHDEPAPCALLPTTAEELKQTLSHALRFDGRRPFKPSSEMMANITAEHLAEQLRRAGFVVMKRPPDRQHSSTVGMSSKRHLTE